MTDISKLAQMKGQKVEGSYYLAECTDCGKMYPSNNLNGGEPLFSGDYGECYCPHCNADDAAIGDCGDAAATAWNYQQDRIDALVEAVEKAKAKADVYDMLRDDYGVREKGVGLADFVDWQANRIAEMESHTVKPPVHPTVASEKLDDETLQELIEFRRTTFEYHSKEGNKVQTIIHGVTLAALRELQERRKADSEPVATLDVQSRRPDGNKFALVFSSAAHKLPDDVYFLYRHAQPEPIVPEEIKHRIGGLDWGWEGEFNRGWNACRAAMLNGGQS